MARHPAHRPPYPTACRTVRWAAPLWGDLEQITLLRGVGVLADLPLRAGLGWIEALAAAMEATEQIDAPPSSEQRIATLLAAGGELR